MIFCDYPIIGSEKELPVYLINMGLQQCQDHVIRRNGYPCPQILFCTKGSGTLLYENKKCLIPPNTVLYLPADFPHEYYPDEDIWNIHWIVPAGDALPLLLGNLDMKEPGIFHLTETTRLEYLFRSMHDALHSDNLLGNYRASGLLYSFLVEFNLCISHRESGNTYHPALIKAIDYINNHYQASITMEELCSHCGISKQHLCLLFRTMLHTRPMEYAAKRRIQVAKELLTGTSMTIEQIAAETGFCTASYFCKMFKRYEGITAVQFKRDFISTV